MGAGHIVPAFTVNALRKAGRPVELAPLPGVDRAAILALVGVAAVDLVAPGAVATGLVAAVAATCIALRLSRWHGLRTLHEPLLWVLHLGYAAAWAVFLASHMLPARPALRGPIVAALGERVFLAAYSALSVLILAWMIGAAGRAPFVPVWGWAWWQAWVVNAAMVAACVLAALGVEVPNPFSIAGVGNDRYDPARPGVLALTRHPVLLALPL